MHVRKLDYFAIELKSEIYPKVSKDYRNENFSICWDYQCHKRVQ